VNGALFCRRSEILPGIYPSISDCTPGSRPAAEYVDYVDRRLGLPGHGQTRAGSGEGLALGAMLSSLPADVPVARKMDLMGSDNPLRSFFPGGGVLISRNGPGAAPAFAVALKGGNNDEPHNHNDVGSFSVVLGRDMVICDPGGEVYTRRTFGPHRYDSNLLNSYGHAVPIIAGQLQRPGADARGVILETNFTDAADVLKLEVDVLVPSTGPQVGKAELQTFKDRLDTVLGRATALVHDGVPPGQLMARLRTDDLGWQFRFSDEQAASFHAELSGRR